MILLIAILFSMIILCWVTWPLIGPVKRQSGSMADELSRERIDSLLAALNRLHQNLAGGNVTQEDFASIERGLVLKLAKLYHQLGVQPKARDDDASCHACGDECRGDYSYCPNCGAQLGAAA